MIMVYSLLTFACWGIADLFYKKGNTNGEKYHDIKTGIIVGIVMGIHALIYLIVNQVHISLIEMIKYLPVSLCYISSMVIGYKGLKFIELSITSPVQNTSGVITSILLLLVFRETLPRIAYLAFVLIFISILYICILEKHENNTERKFEIGKTKKIKILAIILPLVYCLLDGLGTFLDGVYLDKLEIISEDNALVCYELTFLIFAFAAYVFLKRKGEKLSISKEKEKIEAAVFETAGQFFYVFAMSGNSTISASIVGSYCILSMILSRIFLKEKLSIKKYIAIGTAIVGIIILCVLDV